MPTLPRTHARRVIHALTAWLVIQRVAWARVTYSNVAARRLSPTSWGAGPALGLSGLALAAMAGFAALVLPPLVEPEQAAAEERGVVEPVVQALPDANDPPALQVVRQVLGGDAEFGQVVPAPFGCRTPQAVVSATAPAPEGHVGVFVLPAGYGASARESLSRCGRASSVVPGASAVRMQVNGGQVVSWNRGDVLVTLTAAEVSSAAAAAVDARVSAALAPVCADLEPAAADATRNPAHESYAPWTVAQDVTIEPSGEPAVDLAAVPQLEPEPAMTMPGGVAGPPAPTKPAAPQPLTDPGEEILTASVQVPAVDKVGPGCGWVFTAAAAPEVDVDEVADRAEQVRTRARADLLRDQASWLTARAEVEAALPAHLQAVTAWNDYVAAAELVRAQWDRQAQALEEYEEAHEGWQRQVAAHQAWMAERAGAQAEYDERVRACAERLVELAPDGQGETAGIDPSAGAVASGDAASAERPGLTCPAERPAILDEAEPVVDPEPTPPTLWTP